MREGCPPTNPSPPSELSSFCGLKSIRAFFGWGHWGRASLPRVLHAGKGPPKGDSAGSPRLLPGPPQMHHLWGGTAKKKRSAVREDSALHGERQARANEAEGRMIFKAITATWAAGAEPDSLRSKGRSNPTVYIFDIFLLSS